jgi:hypothetical protein
VSDFVKRGEQLRCAAYGCAAAPSQAFDVWSWFRPVEEQTPAHYEVCDEHAADYFGPHHDREASLRIKRDLLEWHAARHPREAPGERRPKKVAA